MSMLLVMIPLSVTLLALAVGLFIWAVRRGQFDDLETPAWRVVLDDDRRPPGAGEAPAPRPDEQQ